MKVKTKAGRKKRKEAVMGYLFAAPWLIGFVVLMAFPLFYSLYLSFTNATTTSISTQWRGISYSDIDGSGVLGECQQYLEVRPLERAAEPAVFPLPCIAFKREGSGEEIVPGAVLYTNACNHCGGCVFVEAAFRFLRRY